MLTVISLQSLPDSHIHHACAFNCLSRLSFLTFLTQYLTMIYGTRHDASFCFENRLKSSSIIAKQAMQPKEHTLAEQQCAGDQLLPQQESTSLRSMFGFSTSRERVYMGVGSLSAALAGVTFPFFLMYFGQITAIFSQPATAAEQGFQLMLKFLLIGCVYWVLTFSSLCSWSFSGSTQSMRLKKLYYETLLEQEVAWFDSIDVGRLAAKVAKNISTIESAIGQKIAVLISAFFTSAFGIVFAFVHCWQLSLFLLAVLPVVIYTGFLLMRAYGLRAKINSASYETASGIAEQAFAAIRTVKCLVGEAFEVHRFRQALLQSNHRAIRYIALVSAFMAAFNFVQFGVYSLGMFLGKQVLLWNLASGKYKPSDIIGTFFCVVSGGSAFGQISPILRNIAQGKEAFKQLMQLVNRRKTLVEHKGSKKLKKINRIALQNVCFRYLKVEQGTAQKPERAQKSERFQEGNEVLRNVSLQFVHRGVNAIVGESGSGKSTIVQLLMRYYDCSSGCITISGHNLRRINIKNFRRKVGFVGQEPILFAMSIEDNLKLADPTLTSQQIEAYLKQANAWDFVQKMEKGIKTYVGSNGAHLSGGQKQRIAIARALCKKPQLLILDQATSALDRRNELEIQQTLQKLSQSKITTIVIAHRLSTVRHADRIFVLDKGQLVQQGSHKSLLSLSGVYSRLVQTQLAAESRGLEDDLMGETVQLERQRSSGKEEDEEGELKEAEGAEEQEENIKESGIYRRLLSSNMPHLAWLLAGGLSSLINGGIVPTFSIAFGSILALLGDVETNNHQINTYCWFFLAIAILASLTAFLYNFSFGVVGDRVVFDMRVAVFDKLLRLPASYYDRKENTPGSISTKLSTEAYNIHNMITGVIAIVTLNSVAVASSLIVALVHCWKVGLLALAFSPLLFLVSFIHISVVKRMASKSERSEKFIGSLISDTVSNIRTVKSFGRSKSFILKFQEEVKELNEIAFQRSLKVSFFQGMRRATIVIVEGVLFWLCGVLLSQGLVQEGSQPILVAIFAIIYGANTIGQNSQHMPDIARARRSSSLLFHILDTPDEYQTAQTQAPTAHRPIVGAIDFRSVSFRYPHRHNYVLRDFSLAVAVGEKVGLVGESGSGKSTVLQLLMRIYEPSSGTILLDGRDIKEYDLYSLRRQIGVVSQQPTMFLGSVRQNVRYNANADSAQLKACLDIACCSRFIAEWQEGWEKQVGHRGTQISGGQKQRLAIARCLLRDPAILLFDESTSALDADTESAVFANLKPVLAGKTSLSVAHRLSTIEDAKWVIVMQEGRTIERGEYRELMLRKGSFYKLAKGK